MVLFFKHNPILRLLTFMVLGYWVSDVCSITNHSIHLLCVGCILLYLFFVVSTNWRFVYQQHALRWVSGITLSCFVFLFGVLWPSFHKPAHINHSFNASFKGVVDEVLGENERNLRVRVVVNHLAHENGESSVKLSGLFYIPKTLVKRDSLLGCVIKGTGFLMPLEKALVPYQFDYGNYLSQQGFSFSLSVKAIEHLQKPSPSSVSVLGERLRSRFKFVFGQSIKNDSLSSVVKALVLGDRTSLDKDLRDNYVIAGAIHVLAVSGLHVGILYMFLGFFMSLASKNRAKILKMLVMLAILWMYAWITRFSPSVTRATIMFSILLIGKTFGHNAALFNSLALSAFIILIVWPGSFFQAGFWLSHLAVVGIGVFYYPIYRLFSFRFIMWRWIWSMVAVSVAAQLTTFPLMLYLFHGFPVYFILANVLILPLVPIVLSGAFVLLMLPVNSWLSMLVAGGVSEGVRLMNGATTWVAGLPHSYLFGLSLTHFEMVLLFVGLIGLSVFVTMPKVPVLTRTLFVFLILIVSVNFRRFATLQNLEVHCNNHSGKTIINILNGRSNIVISDGALTIKEANYIFSGLWARRMVDVPSFFMVDSVVGDAGWVRLSLGNEEVMLFRKGIPDRRFHVKNAIVWLKDANLSALKNIESDNVVLVMPSDKRRHPSLSQLEAIPRIVNLVGKKYHLLSY
jgi:competence protein ComEC